MRTDISDTNTRRAFLLAVPPWLVISVGWRQTLRENLPLAVIWIVVTGAVFVLMRRLLVLAPDRDEDWFTPTRLAVLGFLSALFAFFIPW